MKKPTGRIRFEAVSHVLVRVEFEIYIFNANIHKMIQKINVNVAFTYPETEEISTTHTFIDSVLRNLNIHFSTGCF